MAQAVAQTSLTLLCRQHCDFQSPFSVPCCHLSSTQEMGASGKCSSWR